ncbi:hypothetical protein LJB62_07570 [Bacillus sp. DFI.2.34]|nr:hypothetical protein [Bacillus sp. DFI.2.34]
MATRLVLVTVLRRKTPIFGDEPRSRHRFKAENTNFWRRDLFSSPFWGGKAPILTTRTNLVTILRRETSFFDDEPRSRHRFEAEKPLF